MNYWFERWSDPRRPRAGPGKVHSPGVWPGQGDSRCPWGVQGRPWGFALIPETLQPGKDAGQVGSASELGVSEDPGALFSEGMVEPFSWAAIKSCHNLGVLRQQEFILAQF